MFGICSRGMCCTRAQMASAHPRLASRVLVTFTRARERARTTSVGRIVTHERSKLAAKDPRNEGAMPVPPELTPKVT